MMKTERDSVRVETQCYQDWASPHTVNLDDGKRDKYASLDIFVDGDTEGLVFSFRRPAKLKTDFNFELSRSDAKDLYEILRQRFEE
jgi:hypothetical protein